MDRSYKGYAFLLAIAVVIALPARAMEETPVVWYKKESTQKIASAVIATALVAYIIAVRMDKVASPVALFTALFCSQAAKAINNVNVDSQKNDGQKQENNEQTQEDRTDSVETVNAPDNTPNVVNQSVQVPVIANNQLNDDNHPVVQRIDDVDGDKVDGNNQPEQNLAIQLKQFVSSFDLGSFFHRSDLDSAEKDFSQLI